MKQILFNPFTRYNETTLILIGAILTGLGIYIAMTFNANFDGVLDLHFGEEISMQYSAMQQGINILCLTVFLFLAGLIINKKTRLVDVFATALIARTPYYFLPLFNANDLILNKSTELLNSMNNGSPSTLNIGNYSIILLFSGIAMLILVWYVALLFNGYKTASNAKGSKSVWLFVTALLIAEIISKTLIYLI